MRHLAAVSADGSRHGEAAAGDYVVLAVTDTGVGMEPDVLEHALEPFFTTKGVGEGSGLGLPMIYGFAKQSSGHIAIDSEPGQRTTVKIYLPRVQSAINDIRPEAFRSEPSRPKPKRL